MRRGANSEIYFRCTVCRRRLAIDLAGAGHMVDCPNCSASLLVPAKSTIIPPQYIRTALLATAQVVALVVVAGAGWHMWNGRGTVSMEPQRALVVAAPASVDSAPAEEALTVPPPAPYAADESKLPELEQKYRELSAVNRAVSQRYEELANWVLSNMRGHFLLKDRFVSQLKFNPLSEDMTVTPDIADFLGVNGHEQDLMNDAFSYGWSALAAIESNYIMVTQAAPDRVTLQIPPFEKEGAAMRDDLYRSLETAIGPTRFDRLLQVSEEGLVKGFHYFGSAAHTIVIQLQQSDNSSEAPYLLIKDGWVIPSDQSSRSINTTESATRELPPSYSSYLAWLPDFVTAYVRK